MDSFPYKEIENVMLWKIKGKVSVFFGLCKEAIDVDIGANPSTEGAYEDEGVDDQAVKVVDIVNTFRDSRLEQSVFDKKQFVAFIKNLTPNFVGESMHDDGCLVFAYYKEGVVDPTFLYFACALKEVNC
ncbi:hypothetical protein REPUB_Repub20aG0127000 [Reevesia pubescens]